MTKGRRTTALVVVALLAFVVMAQHRIDARRGGPLEDEARYLPNEKLLSHFTGGMGSIVADMVWLKCLLYTGKHYRGDRDFTWLHHMCETVVRLDPHFVPAFRYGGIFLAALNVDDDAGMALLKQGMVHNPEAWQLPYEVAMIYLLDRRDQPDSTTQAARYLAMAVETGNAPEFVVEVATSLQIQYDLVEIERTMWENSLKSDDRFLRELAERKLQELSLREACTELNKAVGMFNERHGRMPKTINDLVEGKILASAPTDPLGGTFFIGPDGEVLNTTLLDEQTSRVLNRIRNSIRSFQRENGRWPKSLEELIDAGIRKEIPPHPHAGRSWQYDPMTGDVS